MRPLWVDAVDKVGDEWRVGNNRIQGSHSLNQHCAPDSFLDSILLTYASKDLYRQHRSAADLPGDTDSVRLVPRAEIEGRPAVPSTIPRSADHVISLLMLEAIEGLSAITE
jgi:hypothetical protein